MKTLKKILVYSIMLLCLDACGGGSGNSTSSSYPPDGPFSYQQVSQALYAPLKEIEPATNEQLADAAASSCGSAYSYTNYGVQIANKFTNFMPVVGSALSEILNIVSGILSFLGGNDSNICLANQLFDINQQLAQQQAQINNIKNVLNGLQTEFYNTSLGLASQIASNQTVSYNSQLQAISGSAPDAVMTYGMFGNFMKDIGLWINYEQPDPSILSMESFINAQNMTIATAFVFGQQTAFQTGISQISGSTFDISSCYLGNCYQYVKQANTALLATYSSIYTMFQAELNSALNAKQSIIPLFDNYNNTLVAFYLQSANALQQGYSLENIINQMNYYSGEKGISASQVPSLGGVPATYFVWNSAFSIESNTNIFNEAQTQLALMYLARFNQLYINTVQYVVTDGIVGAQIWPIESATLIINDVTLTESPYDYAKVVGSLVSSPREIFGLNSNLASNTMIYQFNGLLNTAQCTNTVTAASQEKSLTHEAANYFNVNSCTSIFARPIPNESSGAYNQTVWTESTLIPYYIADQNSLPIISNSVYGVLSACNNPRQNLYWYQPNNAKQTFGVVGSNYLMCGLWNYNVTDFNMTNSPLQQGDNYYALWSGNYNASFFYYDWYHWATFNMITNKNTPDGSLFIYPTNMEALASDHNGQYFGVGNWNGNMSTLNNINYPQNINPELPVIAGDMPNGYAGTSLYGHELAMQATMPDGFILPYMLAFYNINGSPGNYGAVAYNQNLSNIYYLSESGTPIMLVQNLPMNSQYNPVAIVNNIVFSMNLRMISGGNYTNIAGCNCFVWYYGFISADDYNGQSFVY